MIGNSLVYEKAYKFAIRVVNAYKYLPDEKREFILSKQLLRSSTSIGANIAEANGRATPRYPKVYPLGRRKTQGNARGKEFLPQISLPRFLLLTKNAWKVNIGCLC